MAPETTLRLYRGAADRLRCHILPMGEESWVYWGKEYDYTRFIEQNRRAADVVFAVSGDNIQKWFLRPVFESVIRHGTNKFPHVVSYSEVPVADATIVY